jgi:hypothetical protein
MAKKKLTKVERAERDARHERVLANAQRTRAGRTSASEAGSAELASLGDASLVV